MSTILNLYPRQREALRRLRELASRPDPDGMLMFCGNMIGRRTTIYMLDDGTARAEQTRKALMLRPDLGRVYIIGEPERLHAASMMCQIKMQLAIEKLLALELEASKYSFLSAPTHTVGYGYIPTLPEKRYLTGPASCISRNGSKKKGGRRRYSRNR